MAAAQTLSIPGFSDPISSLMHLAGAGVFVCLTPILLRRGGRDPVRLFCLGVFAIATVLLLGLSGTYHMLPLDSTARDVLRRLDHGAIFVLIAGTFTPIQVFLLRGVLRWGPLLIVWGGAVFGVTFKALMIDGLTDRLWLVGYLGLGWVGLVSGLVLCRRHGWRFMWPLFGGGLAYTIGCVLDSAGWPTIVPGIIGPHEVFHAAVVLGAALYWDFIYRIADQPAPVRTANAE